MMETVRVKDFKPSGFSWRLKTYKKRKQIWSACAFHNIIMQLNNL